MGFHVGQTFGDYSITAVLGAGGMGRVYKVEHSLTNRTEAMKVLTAELASDIQVKRFEREMRSLARLSHPNIAALHNAIHSENQLILLMEYIEGQTLESMFSGGRLPLETGVGYIRQTLLALGYAHKQGIVHRDVTPANVLITAAGEAKLTDFGLSKSYGDSLLTNCGEVLGSLPYMAPEQLKGTTQPDRRSDLYSVGAVLYEHLTGHKPFGANRRLAPVLTDSEADPQPPSLLQPGLSPQWDNILHRALARDPAHRYQSAEEFLDAILQFDQPAAADLPLPQLRTLGIGLIAFAGLVLALVASPVLNRFRQVEPPRPPLQKLHVAPPDFATALTPYIAPAVANPKPPAAKRPVVQQVVQHPKRAARSTEVGVLAPPAPIASAPLAVPLPIAEPPAAPVNVEQDVSPPVASEPTDPAAPQVAPAPKKHFWNKLNVFKKKNADPKDKQ
jgi:eukaryotic-like serine/threonine-protein kinase